MAYVQLDDYAYRITREYLDSILEQAELGTGLTQDEIREDAELTAITEINAYLHSKYLMEDEFAKEATALPDDRNKFVLKCVLDMALYNIHYVINPRDVPETREKAYTMCLDNLAAYRDGELVFLSPPSSGGISLRPIDEGGTRRINIYSQVKFTSKPYSDFNSDEILNNQ